MASPPQSPSPQDERSPSAVAVAVCCMCGDHGLPGELVRCRRCRVRLQHRYCSDLYPKAATYRRCNWCLREPADQQQGRRAGCHAAAAVANNKPDEKRKTASSASDEEQQRQRQEGWRSSRRSPAEPGRLVKKQKHKADEDKMPPPPLAPSAKEIVSDTSGGKEVVWAGKPRMNRVKVRRYKLLAEVISC